MDLQVSPELEIRLNQLAAETGRPASEFVEHALTTYLEDLTEVRGVLASRYDEIVNGTVSAIDGEEFFASLRDRESVLLEAFRSDRRDAR